jgi:stage II sporulation protein AA (anti-sigma F factor antagonist)
MRLALQSQVIDDVVVIRCQGRIVAGPEVDALQNEVEKQTQFRKRVVLHLAEAAYIDSSGLGALVRLSGVLGALGGGLKLCELSGFLIQVLEITHLDSVFLTHRSEREAIDAFLDGARSPHQGQEPSRTKVVCLETSIDLLAFVDAVLKRYGYQVFSTRRLAEAAALVHATQPDLVICGPGVRSLPTGEAAIEKFHRDAPQARILHLASDFSTAEAGQAAVELIGRVQSLMAS